MYAYPASHRGMRCRLLQEGTMSGNLSSRRDRVSRIDELHRRMCCQSVKSASPGIKAPSGRWPALRATLRTVPVTFASLGGPRSYRAHRAPRRPPHSSLDRRWFTDRTEPDRAGASGREWLDRWGVKRLFETGDGPGRARAVFLSPGDLATWHERLFSAPERCLAS